MDDAEESDEYRVLSSNCDNKDFKQQPATKKTQQSLSPLPTRICLLSVTTTEIASMTKSLVPKNTQKNTG